ncbi:MAG TPA: hypothetical protein VHE34_21040 [Puia sp.]|uniref:hypothetical protein n=1 Tax=Puia sp. TaxID=2045100 RepID=UPI002C9CD63D|nr:hypothetical protein [Puia sp.]HVU97729.1 hypothetical protein [Puia sp.]
MKSLADKCMLVNIRFGQWTAKKYDKSVSGEIERQHNATNAGRYNKTLIPEEYLANIHSIVSAARGFLKEQTLPWGDNSDRLIQSADVIGFLDQFRTYKDQFDAEVTSFISKYEQLKQEASWKLNSLYRESDYPTAGRLKKKFFIEVSCLPIGNVDDFRVTVDPAELERLKAGMLKEYQSRMAEATQDIWNRISRIVGHMARKLSDPDAIFRDSLVGNVQDLIGLLPKLNFSEDSVIDEVIDDMRRLIVDPDTLRTDSQIRSRVATEAQQILERLGIAVAEAA